jgi:hypothetical protein
MGTGINATRPLIVVILVANNSLEIFSASGEDLRKSTVTVAAEATIGAAKAAATAKPTIVRDFEEVKVIVKISLNGNTEG